MNLTKGQSLAIQAVEELQKSHPDGGGILTINGVAGSGKTTILKVLAEGSKLRVLAPTGKAALRASEVAPVNSSTIHRWLYEVTEDQQTGKLLTSVKQVLEIPEDKTIYIDEASMVTFGLFKDLYRAAKMYNLNLVFIGDSFQLPPVDGNLKNQDFSIFAEEFPAHYKVKMTEIVRQAMESPIIRASMAVRDMANDLSGLSDLPSIRRSDLFEKSAEVFNDDGFTICHRNATRIAINAGVRKALSYGEEVRQHEPLMVLLNNYDLDVYNGEILNVLEKPTLLGDRHVTVSDRYVNESANVWFYTTSVRTPSGIQPCSFAAQEIQGATGKIAPKFIKKAGKDLSRKLKLADLRENGETLSYDQMLSIQGLPVINANFGYATSCHKSQGSEAGTGIVCIEDSVHLHSLNGRKFVYTALTRFKDSVSICWM